MPIDYPRINQFQEWFPIDPEGNYELTIAKKKIKISGQKLLAGYPVTIPAHEKMYIKLIRL
ncbi:MAG: hypothetical protein R2822_05495 [Spirosomataceae bacterium]